MPHHLICDYFACVFVQLGPEGNGRQVFSLFLCMCPLPLCLHSPWKTKSYLLSAWEQIYFKVEFEEVLDPIGCLGYISLAPPFLVRFPILKQWNFNKHILIIFTSSAAWRVSVKLIICITWSMDLYMCLRNLTISMRNHEIWFI